MNYLKKILGELAMVLDQVEAELEKRKLEYQGLTQVFLPFLMTQKHVQNIYNAILTFILYSHRSEV